jgi:hypothetical protein
MPIGFLVEREKERDYSEDLNVGGRIILKRSSGKYCGVV